MILPKFFRIHTTNLSKGCYTPFLIYRDHTSRLYIKLSWTVLSLKIVTFQKCSIFWPIRGYTWGIKHYSELSTTKNICLIVGHIYPQLQVWGYRCAEVIAKNRFSRFFDMYMGIDYCHPDVNRNLRKVVLRSCQGSPRYRMVSYPFENIDPSGTP